MGSEAAALILQELPQLEAKVKGEVFSSSMVQEDIPRHLEAPEAKLKYFRHNLMLSSDVLTDTLLTST